MRTFVGALSAATLLVSGYAMAQEHDHEAHATPAKAAPPVTKTTPPAPSPSATQQRDCQAMMAGEMQGHARPKAEEKAGSGDPKPMPEAHRAEMHRRCAQMMEAHPNRPPATK